MDANLFGHLANILFAMAYLVKDILWLRLLSMVAYFIMIFFNYFTPEEPLWVAIFWNAAFILVNAVHSFHLFFERKQTQFTGIEKELYEKTFCHMSTVEFSKVLKTGYWSNFSPGAMILEKGERPDALILLYNGVAKVNKSNDNKAIELKGGAFIGEIPMVTDGVASANVKAESEIKAFCWPRDKLEKLFEENPNLKASFQLIMASDMVRTLNSAR